MTAYTILGVEIENMRSLRGMGIRVASLIKDTLRETAEKWHDDLMDSHFTPGNQTRYTLADRTPWYLKITKKIFGQGQGKWVLLKLSEKSQRWMRFFATYPGTSRQVTVRMKAPPYFANPFIGSWVDKRGKTKTVGRQPDKVSEVTRISDADRLKLREFMGQRLQNKIGAAIALRGQN